MSYYLMKWDLMHDMTTDLLGCPKGPTYDRPYKGPKSGPKIQGPRCGAWIKVHNMDPI